MAIDPFHKILQAVMENGLLAPLPIRETKLRIRLYTDDVVMFANPDRHEIETLVSIIEAFGKSAGLCINPQKSTAVQIRCQEIDLDALLVGFWWNQS
jgi:hypothetical protein